MSKSPKYLVSKRWIREMVKTQRADLFIGSEFIETVQLSLDDFIRRITASKRHIVPVMPTSGGAENAVSPVDKRSTERIKKYLSEHPHLITLESLLVILSLQTKNWLEASEMVMLHAERRTLMQKDITLVLALEEHPRVYRVGSSQ